MLLWQTNVFLYLIHPDSSPDLVFNISIVFRIIYPFIFVGNLEEFSDDTESSIISPASKRSRNERSKLPKSLDGKYFKVVKWKNDFNVEAMCQLCPSDAKPIGAATNGTANLSRHIRQKHFEDFPKFNQYICNKKRNFSSDGRIQTTLTKMYFSNISVIATIFIFFFILFILFFLIIFS